MLGDVGQEDLQDFPKCEGYLILLLVITNYEVIVLLTEFQDIRNSEFL